MPGPRIGTGVRLGRAGPQIGRLGGTVAASPTRFYLANANNTRPVTPTPDALWEVATIGALPNAQGGRAFTVKSGTSGGGPSAVKSNAANPCDVLNGQHISDPLTAAVTITGTLSFVIRASESVNTSDAFLQIVVRVVSNDGNTVRGTLYGGQTATAPSASPTSDQFELGTTATTRRISAVPVTPVAAQVGDRLVFETGYRSCSATTGQSGFLRYGDPAGADHVLGVGVTTDLAPWVELSASLTFA